MVDPSSAPNEVLPSSDQALTTANLVQGTLSAPSDDEVSPECESDVRRSIRPPAEHSNASESQPALLPDDETRQLHERWDSIQAAFVDEPRRAVENADNLVAITMKRLAESFAAERTTLEGQWDRGQDISTEDLRLALQRYRSFFNRLLSV